VPRPDIGSVAFEEIAEKNDISTDSAAPGARIGDAYLRLQDRVWDLEQTLYTLVNASQELVRHRNCPIAKDATKRALAKARKVLGDNHAGHIIWPGVGEG
jgi:hypothetical protein